MSIFAEMLNYSYKVRSLSALFILFLRFPLTSFHLFSPAVFSYVNHSHFTAVSAGFKVLVHSLLPSFMSTMHLQVYKNLVVVV